MAAAGFALSLAAVLRLRPRPVAGLREPMSLATPGAGLRFIGQRPLLLGSVSLALARRPVQRRSGAWLPGAVAVFGASMGVFGLSGSLALSIGALPASGAADMVSVAIRQSLVQLATPGAMRGRVSAVNPVFIGASNPLGEFESGATAALCGPVASVVVGGLGTVAVALAWTRLFPALARHDRLMHRDDDKGDRA